MSTNVPEKTTAQKNKNQHNYEELLKFIHDLDDESDRASIVLAASAMDEMLKQILLAYLVPSPTSTDELIMGDSPLSSFSSRIKLVYRLGLYDASFSRSLDIFRRIRNEAAHGTASFTIDSQKDRIKELNKLLSCSGYDLLNTNIYPTMKKTEKHSGYSLNLRVISAYIFVRLQSLFEETTTTKSQPFTLTVSVE